MKKILLGLGAMGIGLAMIPLFAAFEAHVVNVTAKIENALNVSTDKIDFGTVFPQEHLDQPLVVRLSQSFMDEDRVDDVEYFIRQKPKCAVTNETGTALLSATWTGHIVIDETEEDRYYIDCNQDRPEGVEATEDPEAYLLPPLCQYVSKEGEDANDGTTKSFHTPWQVIDTNEGPKIQWSDTPGHLAKSEQDTIDNWIIDLAVPCFGGYCAQDWLDFVRRITGNSELTQQDADTFTQPIENEHKIFGCNLWVEVGGISLPGLGCQGKIDLMLVVDESGSIGDTDMATVRAALHAFIDALVLATDGPNAGQTSFASIGTLDQELTNDPDLMHDAIDTLISGGLTNLTAGIALAQDEFESTRDRADAPNIMLVITDGQPNVGGADPAAEAAAEAAAAQADGTEIYVVGIGDGVNASYLQNSIASAPSVDHYFDGEFGTLQTTILDLVQCEE